MQKFLLWWLSHLKNLCFASASNLLMKSCKTCSPDSLWRRSDHTQKKRKLSKWIQLHSITDGEHVSLVEHIVLTKCWIGQSVRSFRRFCEFQHNASHWLVKRPPLSLSSSFLSINMPIWPTANSDILVCRCSSIYCFYILLKVLYFPATLLPPSVIPPWFVWTVVPLLDPCRYTANIVMCDSKIPRASLKTVPLRLTTCWSHLWYIVEALQVQ